MGDAFYTDSEGRRWQVREFSGGAEGQQAGGDSPLKAGETRLRFVSDGETRWSANAPPEWNRRETLEKLFQQAKGRSR